MLSDAIMEIYGVKEGLTIKGREIVEWPYTEPIPSDKELTDLENAYDFRKEYIAKRVAEYPSLGEQFDLIWHAANDNKTLKESDFYKDIKAIKDKYPKPVT